VAVVFAHRQVRGDDGGALCPCQQFNRHRRELRILRSRLGRIIRDIRRKIAGDERPEEAFSWPLSRAATKMLFEQPVSLPQAFDACSHVRHRTLSVLRV
jgi:hypothetical protein